jgi:hypothetical protein
VPRGQRGGTPRPYSRISRPKPLPFFLQVAPQLYSRGWVDPVTDPLHPRKSGSAGNRIRTSGSVARNSEHRGGLLLSDCIENVRTSTSHTPVGFHDPLQWQLFFYIFKKGIPYTLSFAIMSKRKYRGEAFKRNFYISNKKIRTSFFPVVLRDKSIAHKKKSLSCSKHVNMIFCIHVPLLL